MIAIGAAQWTEESIELAIRMCALDSIGLIPMVTKSHVALCTIQMRHVARTWHRDAAGTARAADHALSSS